MIMPTFPALVQMSRKLFHAHLFVTIDLVIMKGIHYEESEGWTVFVNKFLNFFPDVHYKKPRAFHVGKALLLMDKSHQKKEIFGFSYIAEIA